MQAAVARYCAASESNDMDSLRAVLAPDVQLPSPLFGAMTFKGREDVGFLLAAVYGLLRGLRWEQPIGGGEQQLVIAHATVAGLRIDDAMVFQLDQDGLIRRIRPHLRPMLALSVFALLVPPRVLSRPGVVLRALRRA
ncbi:MAG: nuclear transport factor 2 family protein [Solirubrobacteraceae bacterium]